MKPLEKVLTSGVCVPLVGTERVVTGARPRDPLVHLSLGYGGLRGATGHRHGEFGEKQGVVRVAQPLGGVVDDREGPNSR